MSAENIDTIMCIIAISAIISPILVAIVNNIYNYLIKKLEIKIKVKQQVLSDFANSAMSNWGNGSMVNTKFANALNNLYIYFRVNDNLVKNITEKEHKNIHEYQKDVAKLIKDLAKQI